MNFGWKLKAGDIYSFRVKNNETIYYRKILSVHSSYHVDTTVSRPELDLCKKDSKRFWDKIDLEQDKDDFEDFQLLTESKPISGTLKESANSSFWKV